MFNARPNAELTGRQTAGRQARAGAECTAYSARRGPGGLPLALRLNDQLGGNPVEDDDVLGGLSDLWACGETT